MKHSLKDQNQSNLTSAIKSHQPVLKSLSKIFCLAIFLLGISVLTSCTNAEAGKDKVHQPKTEPATHLTIRANKKSRIFHWKGCPNYDDVSAKNLEVFSSPKEAEERGYRAAKNCPVYQSPSEPNIQSSGKTAQAVVISDYAYCRELPNPLSRVIDILGRNAQLVQIRDERIGPWYQVQDISSGITGWLHGNDFAFIKDLNPKQSSSVKMPDEYSVKGSFSYYDNDDYSQWEECTEDCSGHEAGYSWADSKNIDDNDDCRGNSESFIEGCESYVEETVEDYDDES